MTSTRDTQRRQERLETLAILAATVATSVSLRIERKYNVANSIVFERHALAAALDVYWGLVESFKAQQEFPDQARINSPKKSALTIYALMKAEHRVFRVADDVDNLDETHVVFAEMMFVIEILYLYVRIPYGTLSRRHQSDLAACLWFVKQSPAAADRVVKALLCLYADTWWSNRSQIDKPVDNDAAYVGAPSPAAAGGP